MIKKLIKICNFISLSFLDPLSIIAFMVIDIINDVIDRVNSFID